MLLLLLLISKHNNWSSSSNRENVGAFVSEDANILTSTAGLPWKPGAGKQLKSADVVLLDNKKK